MSIKGFVQYLTETTLSRVWRYFGQADYPAGLMSAFRAEFRGTPKEQAARTWRLAQDVRAAGFGYVFADGKYIERGPDDGGDVKVSETSLVIHGDAGDNGKLKGYMRRWLKAYNQDAVIYKPEGSTHILLLNRDGSETDIGTFHPGREGDMMTRLRGRSHGSFVFEDAYVPMTFMQRLAAKARERIL